ncbi:MAG: DNA polymerase beta superfamily protein [Candidatus Woesearchaeota archaeon]
MEKIVRELCEKNNVQLLYLTKFGSHLYGLDTSNSDIDLSGVFLPSKRDLLLGKKKKSISFSSGSDKEKNSINDIDVNLWSIHYFIELVSKGETNALDLLYSPSNKDCVLYNDKRIRPLFNNPLRLFDPYSANSYIGYCLSQMKKYGLKGTRVGVLKRVWKKLKDIDAIDKKVRDIAQDLLDELYIESYFFNKRINGDDALVLCGKVHLYSISLEEFKNRVKREYDIYGERAKLAEKNDSIDWKACSHAKRAIEQMKMLLKEGKIKFPFTGEKKNFILSIKKGLLPWKDIEDQFIKDIKEIDFLKESEKIVKGKVDKLFIEDFIISLYT